MSKFISYLISPLLCSPGTSYFTYLFPDLSVIPLAASGTPLQPWNTPRLSNYQGNQLLLIQLALFDTSRNQGNREGKWLAWHHTDYLLALAVCTFLVSRNIISSKYLLSALWNVLSGLLGTFYPPGTYQCLSSVSLKMDFILLCLCSWLSAPCLVHKVSKQNYQS